MMVCSYCLEMALRKELIRLSDIVEKDVENVWRCDNCGGRYDVVHSVRYESPYWHGKFPFIPFVIQYR